MYAFLNRGKEVDQTRFLVEVCRERIEKHFVGYVLDVESGNAEADIEKSLDFFKEPRTKMVLLSKDSANENV